MRLLISIACAIVATGLFCHGHFLADEAQALLRQRGDGPDGLEDVVRSHPYSPAGVEARRLLTEEWVATPPAVATKAWSDRAIAATVRSFRNRAPYVLPCGAAAVALVVLALGVLLPGQRFRGLSLTLLIFGGLAVHPWFLGPGYVASAVDAFPPSSAVLAQMPRIAIGLLLLSGLLLAARRHPVRP